MRTSRWRRTAAQRSRSRADWNSDTPITIQLACRAAVAQLGVRPEIRMAHVASTDTTFLETIESWCRGQKEVLALVRFRCGAGSREYRLFSSYSALLELIRASPAGACITIFRNPKLPLRGTVDERFIKTCLAAIPEGAEYLIFETVETVAGKHSWYHYGSGESHAQLKDDLEQSLGLPVVVGYHPSMFVDPTEAVDGIVPDADGTVKAGPY